MINNIIFDYDASEHFVLDNFRFVSFLIIEMQKAKRETKLFGLLPPPYENISYAYKQNIR